MTIHVERRRQKNSLRTSRRAYEAAAMIRCVKQTDFPAMAAQVSGPNVDTAGKDAPLSGQEGI